MIGGNPNSDGSGRLNLRGGLLEGGVRDSWVKKVSCDNGEGVGCRFLCSQQKRTR